MNSNGSKHTKQNSVQPKKRKSVAQSSGRSAASSRRGVSASSTSGKRKAAHSANANAAGQAKRAAAASNTGSAKRSATTVRARSASATARNRVSQDQRARQANARSSKSARKPANKNKSGLASRIASSKAAIALIAVLVVLAGIGLFDTASHWGKAFGNVSVNGVDVGGMTSDEIREAVKYEFAPRVSHAQVTIYSDEIAQQRAADAMAAEEARAIAEQVSVEEDDELIGSWTVDSQSLKAYIPYDDIVEQALAVGRSNGGLLERIALFAEKRDVAFDVELDEAALESVAAEIDQAIGDARIDSTVAIEEGVARAVKGHDGTMVDRAWLADMISRSMLGQGVPSSFAAQATSARSRITLEQAQEMADLVNKAIAEGVLYSYEGRTWLARPSDLGDWTVVNVVEDGGSWKLQPSIDTSIAIPSLVKGVGAEITSQDMNVTFEKTGDGVVVHTSGSGNIPEVAKAIEQTTQALYGENASSEPPSSQEAISIEVTESDRPEVLTFDQAIDLGVITAIGTFTTEFSNYEGTENRNHNIKLAADILTDAVINANGGEWSFNDRSGDTNEDAGFWSAGSIVDGEYVDSIGGGICQVATTIFNAVYEAGLEVTERHNHTLYIASYPTGRDAAVNYPDIDLVWKNDLNSDIYLKLSYTDTSITAELFSVYTGLWAETETGDWEEGAKYKTLFSKDDSLGEGAYYLKTIGEDGSKISVTRTVRNEKDDYVRTDLFASVYEPKDEVYVIGPNVDTSKLVSHNETTSSSSSSDDSLDEY